LLLPLNICASTALLSPVGYFGSIGLALDLSLWGLAAWDDFQRLQRTKQVRAPLRYFTRLAQLGRHPKSSSAGAAGSTHFGTNL